MYSAQFGSVGLRRYQSSVFLRRIALTRSGSSVSARTRGNSACAVRKTSRRTRLSPRASTTRAGKSIELIASRSNFSSGVMGRNAASALGLETALARPWGIALEVSATFLPGSEVGETRARSTADGTERSCPIERPYPAAPGSINPLLAIIVRDSWLTGRPPGRALAAARANLDTSQRSHRKGSRRAIRRGRRLSSHQGDSRLDCVGKNRVLPTGSRLGCVSSRGEGLSTPLASDRSEGGSNESDCPIQRRLTGCPRTPRDREAGRRGRSRAGTGSRVLRQCRRLALHERQAVHHPLDAGRAVQAQDQERCFGRGLGGAGPEGVRGTVTD